MIRVNDDWVIDVGTLDYTPMRDLHRMATLKKKDGTTVEEPAYGAALGYYTSLKNAVRAIAKAEYKNAIKGQEITLSEAINLMEQTIERFEKILEGIEE